MRVQLPPRAPTKNALLSIKSAFFVYPSRRLGISSAVRRYIVKNGVAAFAYHRGVSRVYAFLWLDEIQFLAESENFFKKVADIFPIYSYKQKKPRIKNIKGDITIKENKAVELGNAEMEQVVGGIGHEINIDGGKLNDYLYCEKCGMRFEPGDTIGAVLHEANCTGTPQK